MNSEIDINYPSIDEKKRFDNKVSLNGYQIFTAPLDTLSLKSQITISTLNQYSYCLAEEDPEFKKALLKSDILLPDGVGIVFASKFINGKKIKKIAGADLHEYLLKKMEMEKGSCFYLGSSETNLERIKERLAREYPSIKVACYSPPYKEKFDKRDNILMKEAINSFKPDVLFVGMTAPKQEKWAIENRNLLDAKLICSIGAVFDFYGGTVTRPTRVFVDHGLEWLGRLINEPKRRWRRYLLYGPFFFFLLWKLRWK